MFTTHRLDLGMLFCTFSLLLLTRVRCRTDLVQLVSQVLLILIQGLHTLQTGTASLHNSQQGAPLKGQLTRVGTRRCTCCQVVSTHKNLKQEYLLGIAAYPHSMMHSYAGKVLPVPHYEWVQLRIDT